jgi:hypothetical protein
MKRTFLGVWVVTSLLAMPVIANDAAFPFDRQLAVELAVAYVHADYRQRPDFALPGVDYEHPVVVAVRDDHRRKLVFVTFTSTKAKWGAYVVLELCDSSSLLRPVDTANVDNIESYRAEVAKINSRIYVALPGVCQVE